MKWPEAPETLSKPERKQLHHDVRRHVAPFHLPLPVNGVLFALGFVVPWLKFADIAMHGLTFAIHRRRIDTLPPAVAAFYREKQRALWKRRFIMALGFVVGLLCLGIVLVGAIAWLVVSLLA